MRLAWLWLVVSIGCGGPDPVDETTFADADADADADSDADSDADTDTDPTVTTVSGYTVAELEMCARWTADRADMSEGSWSGNSGSCDAGGLSQTGIDNTVKLVNLYRWLAGQPAVVDDPGMNADAQECSLLMHANNRISHSPEPSWQCYSTQGANAAGASNLATTPAVAAIDLYMVDVGNYDTLGHRRWIIGNWIDPIGVGGTTDYSCLLVGGGDGSGSAEWTAFPGPGPFPLDGMDLGGWSHVDETGWSIQSDSIDLAAATVTVTDEQGTDLAVSVKPLLDWYGSTHALSFVPLGWESQAGRYDIQVTGLATPIDYEVTLVDCDNVP